MKNRQRYGARCEQTVNGERGLRNDKQTPQCNSKHDGSKGPPHSRTRCQPRLY
jgi:hypothetical protein